VAAPVVASFSMMRVGENGEVQLHDPSFFHHELGMP
jgi:hypothetical protein